ncbi:ABC transporter permease [Rubinisphaera margarita]|uniref:ABC transporter permease n=1 Tax=Rubinisphaera margarita TaxID=2909586 RepID=UPI001EE7B893|nr:ABC transporter permease [Rubinisphaera margarita]MCG6155780.1 ABC transporter permease [Rubinisphaera margarita]
MFRFALHNVLSRPVRSGLAILGMTVAIMGMVGLFSIAEGLDRVVGNTLNRVSGFVAMQRGAPIPLFSTLPRAWIEEIETIPGVRAATSECWTRVNVIEGEIVVSPPRMLCGTDIERRSQLEVGLFREDIVAGRFLQPQDVGTRHCVISRQIAEEQEKTVGDPLEVNGYELQIIGVYHTGSLMLDVAIMIDDALFREIARFDEKTVSNFYIEQDGTVSDEELQQRIQNQFRGRGPQAWQGSSFVSASGRNPLSELVTAIDRYLKQATDGASSPGAPESTSTGERKANSAALSDDPMEVRLAADWAGRFDEFIDDLDLALALLTSLGIIIAVVSIVNTMLMSVTERLSEFGILRANGWSQFDLVRLIGWESLTLGTIGGLFGCLIGWAGTLIVNATFPAKFELYASPSLLVVSLLASAILGGLSGLYPAWWVARMNPMDAIRRN